jgi:colanic acid/amylovoran biosynthesis glycosyltransferase
LTREDKGCVVHFMREFARQTETFVVNQVGGMEFTSTAVVCRSHRKDMPPWPLSRRTPVFAFTANGVQTGLERLAYRTLRAALPREIGWYQATLRSLRTALVHGHYGTDAAYLLPVTRKLSVPLVVSWYGYDMSRFPRAFGGLGLRWLRPVLRHATAHVAMTPQMADDLIALGAPQQRIVIHHHGIDVSLWRGAAERRSPEQGRILMVAGFTEKKGHADLLHAFARIARTHPGARLRLVGAGPLRPAAEGLARELQIKERVRFLGYLLHGPALIEEYARAAVFVHPSKTAHNGDREGLPCTILEAMASGVPVVATRHAGISYAVENDVTGMLVDEGDVDGLAHRLELLLNHEPLAARLGMAGRAVIEERFDLRRQMPRLEQFYIEVMAKNTGSEHRVDCCDRDRPLTENQALIASGLSDNSSPPCTAEYADTNSRPIVRPNRSLL